MSSSHRMGNGGPAKDSFTKTAEDLALELGASLWSQAQTIMDAADHVAGDFIRKHRVEYLAQAVHREHPNLSEIRCAQLAELYVWAGE